MQSQNTAIHGTKIGVINGLRGIAIVHVIAVHLLLGLALHPLVRTVVIGSPRFRDIFPFLGGMQPVMLFFILSGFVLALPYIQQRRQMHTFNDVYDFYIRRLRRLGPLYAVCVLISMIFVSPTYFMEGIPMMFTMTFTLHQHTFYPVYNGVLWSLAIEAAFSLFLPFVLMLGQRVSLQRIFVCSLVFSFLVRVAAVVFHGLLPMANGLPGRFDDFMCGVFLAVLFVHGKQKPLKYGLFLGIIFLLLATQLADISAFIAQHFLMNTPTLAYGLDTLFFSLTYSVSNIGFFLIIHGLLRGRYALTTWFLESKSLQMVGLMSYSLYVWHYIMIEPLSATVDFTHFVRYAVMLLALSAVSYRFIEFGHTADFRKLLPSSRTVRFPLASLFRTRETFRTRSA